MKKDRRKTVFQTEDKVTIEKGGFVFLQKREKYGIIETGKRNGVRK